MSWADLTPNTQDALIFVALLLPIGVLGAVLLRGYAPWSLVGAMLGRFRWTAAIFVVVVAVSVAMGVGLIAQERGLRIGTARAADGFDIVVTAPGSEVTMMLASVYLQPTDAPLLDGTTYAAVAGAAHVALAAPLAFGDSVGASPVVGTTADLVTHLAKGPPEGHMFEAEHEAVVGALVPLAIGETFEPAHGVGDGADHDAHDVDFVVVGRMPLTGTPWDNAVVVPIEAVWGVHGLADGHDADHDHAHEAEHEHGPEKLGPPFDPAHFPGTPAIVIKADSLAASYALRSQFTRDRETMAFFPGAVLSQLYGIMGDLRAAMSLMALVSQALVAASVLVGLFILTRLFARHLALLRALGAPGRYLMAVVWAFSGVLLGAGAVLGLGGGVLATWGLSRILSARTGIAVPATFGWAELNLVAGFVLVAMVLALLPAVAALRLPVLARLRA
ncbi:ABC transporter permease family protein [Pseudooceanicola spongiae]|uniref:ABC transporter permease n=1 Tax=Pseudooceanicola spongiae TaxID=2613965 RepID=A0A7L9WLY4_9RHOB|nr:FtsX-like permease family protein [Pseudooceanicola spongiae]QOL80943.1 ABC transporter permease [Pseudooceanicola spongiae]